MTMTETEIRHRVDPCPKGICGEILILAGSTLDFWCDLDEGHDLPHQSWEDSTEFTSIDNGDFDNPVENKSSAVTFMVMWPTKRPDNLTPWHQQE